MNPPSQVSDDVTLREARFGFRFFARRYFLKLSFGTERRSGERLAAEGQMRVPMVPVAYGLLTSVLLFFFGLFCSLYLLKATVGVNLFSARSFLHPIYALFF